MGTPRQKANILIGEFKNLRGGKSAFRSLKQIECISAALLCVAEIQKTSPRFPTFKKKGGSIGTGVEFWDEVELFLESDLRRYKKLKGINECVSSIGNLSSIHFIPSEVGDGLLGNSTITPVARSVEWRHIDFPRILVDDID